MPSQAAGCTSAIRAIPVNVKAALIAVTWFGVSPWRYAHAASRRPAGRIDADGVRGRAPGRLLLGGREAADDVGVRLGARSGRGGAGGHRLSSRRKEVRPASLARSSGSQRVAERLPRLMPCVE